MLFAAAMVGKQCRLTDADLGEFIGNLRVDGFGRRYIAVPLRGLAGAQLADSAPIEGAGLVRLDPQRGVIIGDGQAVEIEPQINQTSAVESVGKIRTKP